MYKPVVLIGQGMRGNTALIDHLCSLNIPVLTTWMGADLIPEDHPAFCGRPGIFGQRAANIIQQKATHFYAFGARMDGEQVFYNYDRFAPNAEIWVHDADRAEFQKFPSRYYDIGQGLSYVIDIVNPAWLAWCRALYCRFRPELDGTDEDPRYMDPFELMHKLSVYSERTDVFAIGSSGNAPTTFYQSFRVKAGQRIHNCCTIGAMGADIPMALGSALASGRRTICVTGDGGFQLNAQELETIRRLHLPIIFFVLNNNGYASIRNNQKVRFAGRVMGSDPKSGLTLPRLEDIALTYGFMYMKLEPKYLPDFAKCLEASPMIVEVVCDPDWVQYPRVMARMLPDGTFDNDDMSDMTPKIDDLQELMDWDG